MYIEQVFAAVVGGKDALRTRFLTDAATHGLTAEQANELFSLIPTPLANRSVLLDVKRRTTDFIAQMEEMKDDGADAPPDHDPALLFRSVEQKFVGADPDTRLQGVWILTDIKQDEHRLRSAFADLDESKVHFAILGDWKPDAYVLARQEQDREYLMELFQLEPSTRFTFKNPNAGNHAIDGDTLQAPLRALTRARHRGR